MRWSGALLGRGRSCQALIGINRSSRLSSGLLHLDRVPWTQNYCPYGRLSRGRWNKSLPTPNFMGVFEKFFLLLNRCQFWSGCNSLRLCIYFIFSPVSCICVMPCCSLELLFLFFQSAPVGVSILFVTVCHWRGWCMCDTNSDGERF